MSVTIVDNEKFDEILKDVLGEDMSLKKLMNDPVYLAEFENARSYFRKYGVGTANYIKHFMHKFTLTADPLIKLDCVRPYIL